MQGGPGASAAQVVRAPTSPPPPFTLTPGISTSTAPGVVGKGSCIRSTHSRQVGGAECSEIRTGEGALTLSGSAEGFLEEVSPEVGPGGSDGQMGGMVFQAGERA